MHAPLTQKAYLAHQKEAGILVKFVFTTSFSAKYARLENIMIPIPTNKMSMPSSRYELRTVNPKLCRPVECLASFNILNTRIILKT